MSPPLVPLEAGTISATRATAVAACAALVLVAVPAQAGPAPDAPAAAACQAAPFPGDPRPVDQADEAVQGRANHCARETTGYPLPARADAEADCHDGPLLVPDCANEAVRRCTTRPAGGPACDPAAGTTLELDASALDGYCLDCAPDLDTRVHYGDRAHQSATWTLVVGLYHCGGGVQAQPGGPGPAPDVRATGSCPPLPVVP